MLCDLIVDVCSIGLASNLFIHLIHLLMCHLAYFQLGVTVNKAATNIVYQFLCRQCFHLSWVNS